MVASDPCWDYQQELLRELAKKSFAELSGLPARQPLQSPAALRGWRLSVLRGDGEHGGVEIAIEARRRRLLIFETVYAPKFEMLPDGTVVEEPLVIDD